MYMQKRENCHVTVHDVSSSNHVILSDLKRPVRWLTQLGIGVPVADTLSGPIIELQSQLHNVDQLIQWARTQANVLND